MLGVAPEGTRSKTGALLQAHDGGLPGERSGATVAPVVAYGQEQAERQWKRLRRPHRRAWEPFRFEDTPTRPAAAICPYTEEMMRRLAELLPPGYRGVYGDQES